MYLLIVVSIIVIGWMVKSIRRTRKLESENGVEHDPHKTFGVFYTGIVAIFWLTIIPSAIVSLCGLVPTVVQENYNAQLAAMRIIDSSEDIFVMGTGTAEGGVSYLVHTRNDDGSATPHLIEADSAVQIIEDDSLTNTAVWSQYIVTPDRAARMYNWTLILPAECVWSNELRVPRGTVRHYFSTN